MNLKNDRFGSGGLTVLAVFTTLCHRNDRYIYSIRDFNSWGAMHLLGFAIKVISHVQQTHSLPLCVNQRYAWETFRKLFLCKREKERLEWFVSQLT